MLQKKKRFFDGKKRSFDGKKRRFKKCLDSFAFTYFITTRLGPVQSLWGHVCPAQSIQTLYPLIYIELVYPQL